MSFEGTVAAMRDLLLIVTRDLELADAYQTACLNEPEELRNTVADQALYTRFKEGRIDVEEVLLTAFYWGRSPQGLLYWNALRKKYGKLCHVVEA